MTVHDKCFIHFRRTHQPVMVRSIPCLYHITFTSLRSYPFLSPDTTSYDYNPFTSCFSTVCTRLFLRPKGMVLFFLHLEPSRKIDIGFSFHPLKFLFINQFSSSSSQYFSLLLKFNKSRYIVCSVSKVSSSLYHLIFCSKEQKFPDFF